MLGKSENLIGYIPCHLVHLLLRHLVLLLRLPLLRLPLFCLSALRHPVLLLLYGELGYQQAGPQGEPPAQPGGDYRGGDGGIQV